MGMTPRFLAEGAINARHPSAGRFQQGGRVANGSSNLLSVRVMLHCCTPASRCSTEFADQSWGPSTVHQQFAVKCTSDKSSNE